MTKPLSEKLEKMLAFKGRRHPLKHPCSEECSGYAQGVDDGSYGQYARLNKVLALMPGIVEALEIIANHDYAGIAMADAHITLAREALARIREVVGE